MIKAGIPELTAFVAIAEQGSFSAAARVLGVSPSALSHSMRGLEARLELRLFNRTTRSVALTEAGQHLLQRVRPALGELEAAVNEVTSARNTPTGSLRISASEWGLRTLLEAMVPAFLAAYPHIHLELVSDTRLVDIVAEGFDAGIRSYDDVPRDMVAVRFGPPIRFGAVASPDYLARHGTPEVPDDLARHRCIRYRFTSGTLFRWELHRHQVQASLDVAGPLTLDSSILRIDAALAGVGIAWVPLAQVAEQLAAGQLVQVMPEWGVEYPGFTLYYPANRHPPTALRLFAEALRDWARERV